MPSALSHPEELVFGANAKRDPETGKIIETGIGSLSQLQQVQAALAAAAEVVAIPMPMVPRTGGGMSERERLQTEIKSATARADEPEAEAAKLRAKIARLITPPVEAAVPDVAG